MTKKDFNETNKFNTEFDNKWLEKGGLISPAIAAKMLGVTISRISQIWKERELEKIIFDDPKKPLLSINDVMQLRKEKFINNMITSQNPEAVHITNDYIVKIIRQGVPLEYCILSDINELQKAINAIKGMNEHFNIQLSFMNDALEQNKETPEDIKEKKIDLSGDGHIECNDGELKEQTLISI